MEKSVNVHSFLFPALGGLLFGYDIGATSGAVISLQCLHWVSGSLYGALLGSLLVYPITDFLDYVALKTRELLVAALLYMLGGFVTVYAPGLGVILIGRLLYGLGIGLAMHSAPLYIAETCPSQIRGTLISLKELLIVLGILCYRFRFSAPAALLMGLGMWSLHLDLAGCFSGHKGSLQEYKEKALSKLRGWPLGDRLPERQMTLFTLKSAYASEESEGSFWVVFQGPSLKAFIIGGGLVLFQQIAGQPSVVYYAGPILQLLMTEIDAFKVDDLGRRPLVIGGVGGIVTYSHHLLVLRPVLLFLLCAYYKSLAGIPLVAVAALLLYIGCNQELQGADNLFLFFGALALPSLLFVIFNVPETKGLSFEEIESKNLEVKIMYYCNLMTAISVKWNDDQSNQAFSPSGMAAQQVNVPVQEDCTDLIATNLDPTARSDN
ncbi:LOW QUALITY PROTEIN: Major facilitator, sugar transporter-like, partial [Dillenia turbinata]